MGRILNDVQKNTSIFGGMLEQMTPFREVL